MPRIPATASRPRLTIALLALATTFGATSHGRAQEPTLVFRGGRIFDSASATSRPLGQLRIAGGKVLAEAPDDAAIPADARVVDTTGKTLVPGMFDLHVHIAVPGAPWSTVVQATPEQNLRSHAYCGVLHVVDLHGNEATIFDLRETSKQAPDMARLYAAGAAFTRPGGHATQFGIPANTIDEPADVTKRMATLLPKQPDVIKAVVEHGGWGGLNEMPTLDDRLFAEVARQTKAAKLPLFSHVWSPAEAMLATRYGANALAHGVFLGPVTDELVAAMQQRDTGYIATLAVVLASVHTMKGNSPYDHALARECLHPDLIGAYLDEATRASLQGSPMVRIGMRQEKLYLNNIKKLEENDIAIGIGTDAGNPLVPHGPAVIFELERHVAAGLTPGQALRSATATAARLLRVDDRFGSLATGKVADVIVVDGDPATDITHMWHIDAVYKAGAACDRAATAAAVKQLARPVVTIAAGTDVAPLVDDFADQDLECDWGGKWEPTTDAIAGGKSKCSVAAAKVDGHDVLKVTGELNKGFQWGPWSGAAVQWDPAVKRLVDASQYTGLRLRIRGTKRNYTVTCHRAAVRDFNFWTAKFEATGEWQTIDLPFESFRQIGFGKRLDWSATDIKGLQIEARNTPMGGTTGPFVLEIDSVSIY
ncbi:MAG: CIA30 family protein [bacterium]|nr:CIA30 family protein [bacterium]